MNVQLKVHGLDALQKQLQELSQGMAAKTLAKAARKAFKPVLEAAIARVPVDTGLTRDSLRIKVVKPSNPNATAVAVGLVIIVGKGARRSEIKGLRGSVREDAKRKSAHWRWHYIEKGTSSQAARPFLRPALDTNADRVVELLREELAKEIRRITKPRGKR